MTRAMKQHSNDAAAHVTISRTQSTDITVNSRDICAFNYCCERNETGNFAFFFYVANMLQESGHTEARLTWLYLTCSPQIVLQNAQ